MSNIDTLVTEYETAKKALTEKIKTAIEPTFQAFFAANPEFVSVEWTQYTPYFNDGEPCEFSVGDFVYTLKPELYTDEEKRELVEDGSYDLYELEHGTDSPIWAPGPRERERGWYASEVERFEALPDAERETRYRLTGAWDKLVATLQAIPEEIFLDAFEDHSQIKVTREGVEIEEYSHD